ncbi:cobalamin B12-binding domain-containing protein [Roseovarius aestuariivivens]|uniref:cobalamin B12-binding domain-containing protein n=1 Tax=Roseovarius aestuariivivens TaxID=1888910 RepID=UPI001FD965A1|nr:cobalamin B12-binding domain-containing protein [Roseovarius aestuariivivens]
MRTVSSKSNTTEPRTREQWVARLCEALMSESEASYQSVLSSLMATGVSSQEIYQSYIPSAARYLGELWVSDQASFVDVTVGASRLQSLFRTDAAASTMRWTDRSVPLGQSVLMVIPEFEQHALGAFVAADNMRRHGLWVHMAIGLKNSELVELVRSSRFAMIGVTAATRSSIEKVTGMVDYLRTNADYVPPIVVGGRAVDEDEKLVMRTGADFAVRTAREAIEKCGLSSVAEAVPFNGIA